MIELYKDFKNINFSFEGLDEKRVKYSVSTDNYFVFVINHNVYLYDYVSRNIVSHVDFIPPVDNGKIITNLNKGANFNNMNFPDKYTIIHIPPASTKIFFLQENESYYINLILGLDKIKFSFMSNHNNILKNPNYMLYVYKDEPNHPRTGIFK